jgi:hypothetical protein
VSCLPLFLVGMVGIAYGDTTKDGKLTALFYIIPNHYILFAIAPRSSKMHIHFYLLISNLSCLPVWHPLPHTTSSHVVIPCRVLCECDMCIVRLNCYLSPFFFSFLFFFFFFFLLLFKMWEHHPRNFNFYQSSYPGCLLGC